LDIQVTVSIAVDDELFTLQDENGNKVGEHDEIKFRIRPDTTFEHVLFQALRLSSIVEPQTADYFLLAQLGHSEFTIESDDTIISLQHYLEISEDHIVDLMETVMRFVVVRYSDYEDEEQQQAHEDEQQQVQRASLDQTVPLASPPAHHQAIADPEEPLSASPVPESRSVLDLVDSMQREYDGQDKQQPSSSPSELHKQSALDALSGRRTAPTQPNRRSGEGAPKKMPMRLSQELPERRISITEALGGGRRRSSDHVVDSEHIEARWSARNPFKTLVASNRLSRQQQHLPQRVIDIDGVRTTARLSKEMSPRTSLRLSLTDFSARISDGSGGTGRGSNVSEEPLSEDETEAEQQATHMVKNFFQAISPPQDSPPATLRQFHVSQQAEGSSNGSSPLRATHAVPHDDDDEEAAAATVQPSLAGRSNSSSPRLEKSRAVDDMMAKEGGASGVSPPDAAESMSSSDTIANHHHHMHDSNAINSHRDLSILSDATVSSHAADHDANSSGSTPREPSTHLSATALAKIFSDFKSLDSFMDDSIRRARGLLPATTSERSRALKSQQQERLVALLSESNSTLPDGHSPATPQGLTGGGQNSELLASLLMDVQKMNAGSSQRDSLTSEATTASSASLPSPTHDRERGMVEPHVKRVVGRAGAEEEDDPSSSSMMMMLMTDEWATLPPTKELMTHLYVDPSTLPPTMVDFAQRSRDACEHLDRLERDLDQLMEQFVRAF